MDNWTAYLRALYWCITTLATVGYGDIIPSTNAQTIYAMVVMILGVGVCGYVIGNVASLLANLDRARAHYLANLERLATFLTYRVSHRICNGGSMNIITTSGRIALAMTNQPYWLSFPPRSERKCPALNQDFIQKVPFFKGASQELIRDIALALRPIIFTPGDYVFRAGRGGSSNVLHRAWDGRSPFRRWSYHLCQADRRRFLWGNCLAPQLTAYGKHSGTGLLRLVCPQQRNVRPRPRALSRIRQTHSDHRQTTSSATSIGWKGKIISSVSCDSEKKRKYCISSS